MFIFLIYYDKFCGDKVVWFYGWLWVFMDIYKIDLI